MVKISGARLRGVSIIGPDFLKKDCVVSQLNSCFKAARDFNDRLRAESARSEILTASILRKALAGGL